MRNLDEVGANAAAKYNGKPVLIAKRARCTTSGRSSARGDAAAAGGDAAGDGAVSFLEMDINVHRFSYPGARRAAVDLRPVLRDGDGRRLQTRHRGALRRRTAGDARRGADAEQGAWDLVAVAL